MTLWILHLQFEAETRTCAADLRAISWAVQYLSLRRNARRVLFEGIPTTLGGMGFPFCAVGGRDGETEDVLSNN